MLSTATTLLSLARAASPLPEGFVTGERWGDGSGIVAVSTPDGGQQWFALPTAFLPEQDLRVRAAGSEVDELLAAPDSRWLAVVSSEDGWTVLEVVELEPLVRSREYRVVATLDPAPGSLRIAGWHGRELVLRSEWPLDRCSGDCSGLTEGALGQERAFLLDPESRRVRAAGIGDDFHLLEIDDLE